MYNTQISWVIHLWGIDILVNTQGLVQKVPSNVPTELVGSLERGPGLLASVAQDRRLGSAKVGESCASALLYLPSELVAWPFLANLPWS